MTTTAKHAIMHRGVYQPSMTRGPVLDGLPHIGTMSEALFSRFREAVALAKTLNFNTTAALLHISQPTLTRHIAALEKELGFKLFNRFPMELTPEGQFFVTATEKLLSDYDGIIGQCREMARRSQEAIVLNMVMASNSLWSNIFYEGISVIQERYPEAAIPHFCQNRSLPIDASVFAGVADIGMVFRVPEIIPEGFTCELLTEFPLAAFFRRDNILAGREAVTFDDLADQYLVCPTNPQLRATFDGAVDTFLRNGHEPLYRVREFNDFDRIKFLLEPDEFVFGNAEGHLMTSASTLLAGSPLRAEFTDYPVYLIYRADSSKPLVKTFVSICHSIAKRMRGEASEN